MYRQLIALIILFTSAVLPTGAMADATWHPFGPGGGGWIEDVVSHNRQFAIDPRDPQHLYWGVCNMILASHDGGMKWQAVYGKRPAIGDDQTPGIGHAITVAADGSVVALDHDTILHVSRDHGASWSELTSPPVAENSSDTPAFPFFLADGTLCVACRPSPGLAISKDGGKAWLKRDSSLMCRSIDDGVSWTGSTKGIQPWKSELTKWANY